MKTSIIAIGLCLLFAGNSFSIESKLNIPYGPAEAQKLDVWWKSGQTNAPIIFMVHGGGWSAGDKRTYSNEIMAEMVTDLGCTLVSCNYRLLDSADDPTAQEQVQDVWTALAWIREHADDFGMDKNRVITGGSSAGAHLSSAIAYGNERPWLKGTPYEGQEKEIVSSIKGWYGDSSAIDLSNGPSCMYEIFNPIDEISAGEPPALCVNGDEDNVTPLSNVFRLKKIMESNEIPCTLLIIPHGKHMTGTRILFKDNPDAISDTAALPDSLKDLEAYQEMREKVRTQLTTFIKNCCFQN